MIFFQRELSFLASASFELIALFVIKDKDLFLRPISFSMLKLNFHSMKVFAQSIYFILTEINILALTFEFIFYAHLIILEILIFLAPYNQ
jgi:hypothetical protein